MTMATFNIQSLVWKCISLTVLLATTATAQNPPKCSCTPTVYRWKLDFDSFCDYSSNSNEDGTLGTNAPEIGNDRGIESATCAVLNENQETETNSETFVPVKVSGYQLIELGQNLQRIKVESGEALDLKDGDNITFSSVFDSDPSEIPRGFIAFIFAENAAGEVIELQWFVRFSNLCEIPPFEATNTMGWMVFDATSVPAGNSCEAPSASPSLSPTSVPTESPTSFPTLAPSLTPTPVPTASPTASPTPVPTSVPTSVPTASPTASPTPVPTSVPTSVPTASPTASPTPVPTSMPTPGPTVPPTKAPTTAPTLAPTSGPTVPPTKTPTATPTTAPTPVPTMAPTTASPTITAAPSIVSSTAPSTEPNIPCIGCSKTTKAPKASKAPKLGKKAKKQKKTSWDYGDDASTKKGKKSKSWQ